MSDIFTIENVVALKPEELNKGFYLHMYKADCEPPHIAFSIEGILYELNHNGPRIRNDINALLSLLTTKNIKALFFEIRALKKLTTTESKQILEGFMNGYNGFHETNNVSCLSPIKDFFKWGYNIETEKVNFVFDLLPLLRNDNLIIKTSHLNMAELINENGSVCLKKYNREAINNRIQEIKSRKQRN